MVGKGVAGCRGRIHSAYNGEGGEIVIWPVISYYTEYRKHSPSGAWNMHCLVLKVWQITLKSFSQEQSKSPSYQFNGESSELGASVPLILTFCFLGRGGRHAGELDQPEAGVPGDDAGPRR